MIVHLTPTERPVIRCVYSERVAVQEDEWLGKVIRVQGNNSAGEGFTTEVFIFKDGDRIVAKNILWWSGMGYSSMYPAETDSHPTEAKGSQCPQS